MPNLYHIYTQGGGQNWWHHSGRRAAKTFGGITYVSQPIRRERFQNSLVDQEVMIEVGFDFEPWSYFTSGNSAANLWVDIKNYDTGAREFLGIVTGIELSLPTGTAKVRIRNWVSVSRGEIPDHPFAPSCPYALYGTRCGVNSDLYKIIVAAADVSSNPSQASLTAIVFGTQPNGYFEGGVIMRGFEQAYIIKHVGTTIWLFNRFYTALGSNYTILPGCDKTRGACHSKFSNNVRFGGYPFVPFINPVTDTIQV